MCRRMDDAERAARQKAVNAPVFDGPKAKPCPHPFVTGANVRHDIFGIGHVYLHSNETTSILFDKHGDKTFMVEFASKRMKVVQ